MSSHVSEMGFDLGFYVALQSLSAPNHKDAMFTLAAFLLYRAHIVSTERENKDKLTRNLKVANLHRFLAATSRFKLLQVVVRIDFQGTLLRLPIHVHAVANIINLEGGGEVLERLINQANKSTLFLT